MPADIKLLTCCFTGHRRLDGVDAALLCARIERAVLALMEDGYTRFCAGGALGFDTLAAQTVLRLRERYPQLSLVLMLPCRDQHRYWRAHERALYEDILSKADEVIYIGEQYSAGCMHRRNRALVAASSACICFVTHAGGGSHYTVRQARQGGLRVLSVAPRGDISP